MKSKRARSKLTMASCKLGTPDHGDDDADNDDDDLASFHLEAPPGFQVPTASRREILCTPQQGVSVYAC